MATSEAPAETLAVHDIAVIAEANSVGRIGQMLMCMTCRRVLGSTPSSAIKVQDIVSASRDHMQNARPAPLPMKRAAKHGRSGNPAKR